MFDALRAGEPELRCTAADVVRAGGRVRRRRRALAVAGTGLTTAAVVLAVALLPRGHGGGPAGPAGPRTAGTTTTGPVPPETLPMDRSPVDTSPAGVLTSPGA
ncbi:hypothetical protein [Umezawaea beigongshangensis]|uniref:hypothetical protein n=1 Tax=Umezawaea beigongshangensis TaxID=2780383 RepID=UPI0018F267B9|nr:hypothetical protein [Umezawaea beigongshangensis]